MMPYYIAHEFIYITYSQEYKMITCINTEFTCVYIYTYVFVYHGIHIVDCLSHRTAISIYIHTHTPCDVLNTPTVKLYIHLMCIYIYFLDTPYSTKT